MLKKILNRSEFTKHVATLSSGTAIAQIIPIAISPLLTRMYTPDDFGVWALFVSIAAIVGVVATGRFELAIVLPKEDKDAVNILGLSIGIAFLISIASLLVILILNPFLDSWIEKKEVIDWLLLIPLIVLFTGIYQAFSYWSTRNKTFKKNALSRVSQSSGMSAVNLSMGAMHMGHSGLIIGTVVGQIIAAIVIAWSAIKNPRKFFADLSKEGIKTNMKRYGNFVKINTPHALVDSFQNNAIVFFLVYFFSSSIVGFYNFAFRILKAPMALIGASMHQVFFQKISTAYNDGENIQKLMFRLMKNTALIGLLPFVILFFVAPNLFAFVFGAEWRVAGEIAQILTPWLYLNFIVSPASSITLVLNKQKEALWITLVDMSMRFGALIIGGIMNDFKLSFILMSITCSSLMIFAIFWYYRISGANSEVKYK